MTDPISSAVSPFRRGLRYFGSNSSKFYLIFIHDFQSWSKKRLMEFFVSELPNYNTIIQSLTKKKTHLLTEHILL